MRPVLRPLERVGKEYRVVLRSGRIEYRSTCYAKAVGVHDYLEQRAESAKREDRRQAISFKEQRT